MKYCCFRFDADTHACVSQGIPRLVELANELGVKFTFFVNMGRSFDLRITAAKMLGRWLRGGRRGSMSVADKLGWRGALKAVLLNPQVGRSDPAALQGAVQSGHEIGLHGGRNHAWWERSAQTWSEERLSEEIELGLRWMAECGLPRPTAFSSPSWNSPPALLRVLPAHRFRFLVDTYDANCQDAVTTGEITSVPTNITAEPQSAGYLEIMRLRGWSTGRIVKDFQSQIVAKNRLAMVYDHPFFAGLHALEQVRELVHVAQEEDFCVETVSTAAQALCEANEAVSALRF